MTGLIDGKSALATGGESGIGRATALAFAREGARVLVADRHEAEAQETIGLINAADGQMISMMADVVRECVT
jgi:NAD(P)-dependent dehydrogenase (short-subunit alcohol dehydrogenase family)